jgi:hypothetical protein
VANLQATERERFALHALLRGLEPKDRAERRNWDAVWDAFKLDEINEQLAAAGAKGLGANEFNGEAMTDHEITSHQRDMLINKLDTSFPLPLGRLLRRFDADLLKSRDGATTP